MKANNTAAMREIPQPDPNWKDVCAKCNDGEIEPKFCAYYGEPNGCNSPIYGKHPTAEKSSTVGDAAAMREALREICEYIESFRKYIVPGKHKRLTALFAVVDTIFAKARAALSAPQRNCDVGSVEEQTERFIDYCSRCEKSKMDIELIRDRSKCIVRWAQMPYEEGATK